MAGSMLSSAFGRFRLISILEGISYILLLGIAVPLKYVGNMPEATQVPGMAHGVLFVLYIILLIMAGIERKWSFLKIVLLFFISIIPFGFLIAEFMILRKEANKVAA